MNKMNCSRELEIMQIFGVRSGTKTCFSGSLFLILPSRWFLFPTEPSNPLKAAIWKLTCGRLTLSLIKHLGKLAVSILEYFEYATGK